MVERQKEEKGPERPGSKTYLPDELRDVGGERLVDEVLDDAHDLRVAVRGVAGHVLVEHGGDVAAGALVGAEDVLAAEQAGLLAGVPVELDCVLRLAGLERLVAEQHAQRLEDGHAAGGVVVDARGRAVAVAAVDAVEVRAYDDRLRGLARDLGHDAVLHEAVLKGRDGHAGRAGRVDNGGDLLLQPQGRVAAGGALVVPVGVPGEGGEVGLQVALLDAGDEAIDLLLLRGPLGERDSDSRGFEILGAGNFFVAGDVEEFGAILN